jgi:hypothetical protein
MDAAAPEPISQSYDHEDRRPLDAWERYRALNAAMDEAYELIDLNNREGRFALILMSGLNAAVLVAGTRNDIASLLMANMRPLAISLFLIYVVVALYYTLQAVDALRPGHFRPQLGSWPKDRSDYPKGVRYRRIIARDAGAYWRRGAGDDEQLNAELAVQVRSLCIQVPAHCAPPPVTAWLHDAPANRHRRALRHRPEITPFGF